MAQAIILAAGESSRFWPFSEAKHKSLITLLGKTIIEHTVESVGKSGLENILVVVSPRDKELFEKALKGKAELVVQNEPKGMGDAIMRCENRLTSSFFVLNADRFDAASLMMQMQQKAAETQAEMVLASTKTKHPWKYGILTIKDGFAKEITEKPKKGEEPSDDKIIGLYWLPKEFLAYYKKCKIHTYAFEDALSLYMKKHKVPVVSVEHEEISLKYSWDLLGVAKELLAHKLENGQDIAPTAAIAKNAVIEGMVHIGRNSKVLENAVIKGPVWVGDNCTVGNNSLVRENSVIENDCTIGMGTEVARSVFLEGSGIHSGFVGDSIVGEKTKIGAGFVTANRRLDREEIQPLVKQEKTSTKKTSLGAMIGHGTKIGVMSSTMPGTIIGNDCVIGFDTHVKGTIESNTTIYTQAEQVVQKKKE